MPQAVDFTQPQTQQLCRDEPCRVDYLFKPDIIMVKNWPRVWTFRCASCKHEQSRFGWFGYVRCRFCEQLHAPKWNFPGAGY